MIEVYGVRAVHEAYLIAQYHDDLHGESGCYQVCRSVWAYYVTPNWQVRAIVEGPHLKIFVVVSRIPTSDLTRQLKAEMFDQYGRLWAVELYWDFYSELL